MRFLFCILLLCSGQRIWAQPSVAELNRVVVQAANDEQLLARLRILLKPLNRDQVEETLDNWLLHNARHDSSGQRLGKVISAAATLHPAMTGAPQTVTYLHNLLRRQDFALPSTQRIIALFLGTSYHSVGDFDKSRWWLERYVNLYQPHPYEGGHLNGLTTLALIYAHNGDHKLALPLHEQVIQLATTGGVKAWVGLGHGNLGQLLFEMGQWDAALPHVRIDIESSLAQGWFMSAAGGYRLLSQYYLRKRNQRQARVMADSALLLATRPDAGASDAGMERIYRTQAAVAEQGGQPAEALLWLNKAYQLADSGAARLQRLRTSTQLAVMEEQQRLLNTQQLRTVAAAKRRSDEWLITGIVLSLLLGGGGGLALWQQRRLNRAVLVQKQKALAAQALAEKGQEQLTLINATKNKLFSIVAHDLRGPISNLDTLLQSMDSQMVPVEFVQQALPLIRHQTAELGAMMDNLLCWAQAQQEGIHTQPQQFLLLPLAQKVQRLLAANAEEKNVQLHLALEPGVHLFADPQQMEVVVRNLLSNAIKFSQSGGEVRLTAHVQEGHCHLSVTDNGVGMSPEKMATLFVAQQVGSTYGTNGEKGVGLGLVICQEFLRNNRGSISVQANHPRGSIFHLILPSTKPQPVVEEGLKLVPGVRSN